MWKKAASNPIPIPAILTKKMLMYFAKAVLNEKKLWYSVPNIMVLISGIPEPYASLEMKSQVTEAIIEQKTLKIRKREN